MFSDPNQFLGCKVPDLDEEDLARKVMNHTTSQYTARRTVKIAQLSQVQWDQDKLLALLEQQGLSPRDLAQARKLDLPTLIEYSLPFWKNLKKNMRYIEPKQNQDSVVAFTYALIGREAPDQEYTFTPARTRVNREIALQNLADEHEAIEATKRWTHMAVAAERFQIYWSELFKTHHDVDIDTFDKLAAVSDAEFRNWLKNRPIHVPRGRYPEKTQEEKSTKRAKKQSQVLEKEYKQIKSGAKDLISDQKRQPEIQSKKQSPEKRKSMLAKRIVTYDTEANGPRTVNAETYPEGRGTSPASLVETMSEMLQAGSIEGIRAAAKKQEERALQSPANTSKKKK